MKKAIDGSPQFTRVSSSRRYKFRVVVSLSFDDGSMIMISSRAKSYKIMR